MNLKQKRLLQEIVKPECKSIKEASRKAGYGEYSRNMYRQSTKRHIESIMPFTAEQIKAEYVKVYEDSTKKSDKLHALDSMARIHSLFNDKQTIQQDITTNDKAVLQRYIRIPLTNNDLQEKST